VIRDIGAFIGDMVRILLGCPEWCAMRPGVDAKNYTPSGHVSGESIVIEAAWFNSHDGLNQS